MPLTLRKRSKSKKGTARVKTTSKNLHGLVSELAEKAKRGEINVGEVKERYERAEADDGLFSKHWSQPVGAARGAGGVSPRHANPINWQNPGDASRSSKSVERNIVQKLYEGVIEGVPGGTPHLLDENDMRAQKRLQDLHDGLVLCVAQIEGFNPYQSKYFPEYEALSKQLVNKILSTQGGGTSTGTGGDFIPNTLSGTLVELFRQSLVLGAALPHINMPESPFRMPLEGADVDPYFVPEATTDENTGTHSADAIATRTPATSQITFTAKSMKVRGLISEEAQEDAIISMIDYMRRKLVQAIAEGLEDCLVNGDDSSTHQDSDVTAATDHRKAFDGLRQLANSNATFDTSGKLEALDFLNVFTKMGKYAQNPNETLLIVSPIGLAHLTGDSNMITVDKLGARATLLTGQVGSILGRPVMVSGKVRENLNASGVYDGSTTDKTQALVVHRPSFAIGDRRNVTVESAKDITTGKFIVVVTARIDFQRVNPEVASPQARNVGHVYNIDTTATF